jgi:hypothetical protein
MLKAANRYRQMHAATTAMPSLPPMLFAVLILLSFFVQRPYAFAS